jgi:hypothetical protein
MSPGVIHQYDNCRRIFRGMKAERVQLATRQLRNPGRHVAPTELCMHILEG